MPMSVLSFEGKNLEEALKKASTKLNIEKDQLKYQIKENKKSLFANKVIVEIENEISLEVFIDDLYTMTKQFFDKIFEFFSMTGEITYPVYKDNYMIIRIESSNDVFFIKNNAKHLLALQTLINSICKKALNFEPRIILDCKDYRLYRNKFLQDIAREKANDVKKTGRIFIFHPLDAYERKIIHIELQDDPKVTTESEGNTKFKCVKIMPTDGSSKKEDKSKGRNSSADNNNFKNINRKQGHNYS